MSLFVNRKARFSISFVTALGKDGETLYCDVDEATLKDINESDVDEATIAKHTCEFRKPSYGDSTAIMDSAIAIADGKISVKPSIAAFEKLNRLLVSWSLKDGDDKPVPITPAAIGELEPQVAAVISLLLEEQLSK